MYGASELIVHTRRNLPMGAILTRYKYVAHLAPFLAPSFPLLSS